LIRNTKSKLLRTVSILLLISGLFILAFIILFLFQSTYALLLSNSAINVTIGLLGSFYIFMAELTYFPFIVILISFVLIDLLCAFYVYKGKKVFWWIAAVRSLITSLNIIVMTVLAFKGFGSFSIFQKLVCFIYYGVIFILLIMSRKTLLVEKGEN
jgi:hypothetical protein